MTIGASERLDADAIWMLEVKARNELDDPVVLAKRDAAAKSCKHASEYSAKHGAKPWRYGLVPHDRIADNMSVEALVQSGVASPAASTYASREPR